MNDILARLSTGRAMVLGIGIAVIYYFTMYDNGTAQNSRITQAKSQVAEMKGKIKEDQTKLDRALVYKKTATETGTTIDKLLSSIPEKFDIPDLMKIVSNEAKVAGTSLTSITPGNTEISSVGKEFEEISVTVDMGGTFLQQMVFLSNLTKQNQILIIRKFTMGLGRETKTDEAPNVHLNAEVVAFRYRGTLVNNPAAPGGADKGSVTK